MGARQALGKGFGLVLVCDQRHDTMSRSGYGRQMPIGSCSCIRDESLGWQMQGWRWVAKNAWMSVSSRGTSTRHEPDVAGWSCHNHPPKLGYKFAFRLGETLVVPRVA
jgi:hypothetical protein